MITIFFGLSYISRFLVIEFEYGKTDILSLYAKNLSIVFVWLFEAASLGALMIFHLVNFQQGRLLSDPESRQTCISIAKEELHYFTDAEVEAHNLADESSYSIQDLTVNSDTANPIKLKKRSKSVQ